MFGSFHLSPLDRRTNEEKRELPKLILHNENEKKCREDITFVACVHLKKKKEKKEKKKREKKRKKKLRKFLALRIVSSFFY